MANTNLTNNLADLESLLQATREQALMEQERVKLESEQLKEERRRRQVEEERLNALKEISEKIDDLLTLITTHIVPHIDVLMKNSDIIAEVVRIIAYSLPNVNAIDAKTLKDLLNKTVSLTNPVHVYTAPAFTASDNLNISTQGDQKIG